MVQFAPGKKNVFANIGSGVAQGLAEQLPKEIERGRLSQGLQQFANESANMTPQQQLAYIAGLPGVTPQLIQSMGELAQKAASRQGFQNRPRQRSQEKFEVSQQQPGVRLSEAQFAPSQGKSAQMQKGVAPEPTVMKPQEVGQPQINPESPVRPEAEPAMPWSQDRWDDEVGKQLARDPTASIETAMQRANQEEARDLARPVAERARDEYRRETQNRVFEKFNNQLANKLQKAGPDIYSDITGEMQEKLKRSMEREIALRKNSEDDVINKWTEKALDLAKTKKQIESRASRDYLDNILPSRKQETISGLRAAQKVFADSNNQEEMYNLLRSNYNLSPQMAANISNPINKDVNKYVSSIKPITTIHIPEPQKNADNARKRAIEVEPFLKDQTQSILSIAQAIQDKDPYFDLQSFLNQIREDQDVLGLSPQQSRELEPLEGVLDVFPNWGDMFLFPLGIWR